MRQVPTNPADILPGVEYVAGDVTNAATLPAARITDCVAVIHLVGIITENPAKNQTFQTVHVGGTQNLINAVQSGGFGGRFIYISALGASKTSASEYSRTKATAEEIVQRSGLPATIFRPSIVLGPNCAFLQQMEELVKRPPLTPFPLPFVPVPGSGENRFQPVWVGDLCAALVSVLSKNNPAVNRIFDLGGADTVSFNELIEAVAKALGIKKPLLHAPMGAMKFAARAMEAVLPRPPITVDQLTNLQTNNTGDISALREILGVSPLPFAEALARCYRKQ